MSSVFPVRSGHTMSEHITPQIPDDLRPYLDTIADRLLSGHAAVMIGAGFSKNAVLCLLFIHPRAPNLISLRSAGTMAA